MPDIAPIIAPVPVSAEMAPQPSVLDKESILKRIDHYASLYGLTDIQKERMIKTIDCESGFDPTIQSWHVNENGEREESYGLVQIHLPAHPTISKVQALDPEFSIDFIAKHFSEKKYHLWTCYTKHFPSSRSK